MNKICTSIEQSKQLVDLGIDVNTADMCYGIDDDTLKYDDLPWLIPYHKYTNKEFYIPCWSLTALLNIVPYPSLHSTFMGWRCDSYNKEGTSCIFGENADNPVDTCYEMILKLKYIDSL